MKYDNQFTAEAQLAYKIWQAKWLAAWQNILAKFGTTKPPEQTKHNYTDPWEKM